MEGPDRRNMLWGLAALLALPLLKGPGNLLRGLWGSAAGPAKDLATLRDGAPPRGPRPRVNPPEQSVKRRV